MGKVIVSLLSALTQSVLVALTIFGTTGVVIAALIWPRMALVVLCACAGLPTLILPVAGQHIHLVEPAIVLCFFIVVIHRPPVRLSIAHVLALAFLLLALISFLHVPEVAASPCVCVAHPAREAYGADKRLLALCFVFSAFFCGTLLAPYVRDCTRFLCDILFVSLPVYLVALAEMLGVPLPLWLEASGANNLKITLGRLWGPFPWSVNFGMYLVNLFAIAIACWSLGKQRWQRTLGMLMTLITTLSIIGTGTRSVTCAAFIIALIAFGMTRHFKLLGGTLLLATTAGLLFSAQIVMFFTHDETSTANRLLIWNLALKLIQANPWLGVGLEQFHYYYAQLIVSRTSELGALGIHPHEQYLEWAMESGLPWLILGIFFLLSVVTCCARAYYAAYAVARDRQIILLAAGLAMLANIGIGFFDAPLDQLEGPVLLFLLAGLALGSPALSPFTSMAEALPWRYMYHFRQGSAAKLPMRRSIYSFRRSTQRDDEEQKETRLDGASTGRAMLFQIVSWSIALPLVFPTTALLARYLGPVQYGEYTLTFPFLTIFALLSGTGMDPLIIRQLSGQPRATWGATLSYALGSRIASTMMCIFAAIIVACLLPVHTEQRNLFLLGSASLLFSFSFNGVRIIFSHGFRAEQRVGSLAIVEAANRILTTGLVALVVMLHLSLLWIYVILVYSDLPAFLLQIWLACRRYAISLRFSPAHLREHMLTSLPLMGHRILSFLAGQIDLLLLTMESTPLNVGIYALASRLTDPLISIAHACVNSLYPLFCRSFRADRERFATLYMEAVRVLLLIAVPCVVLANVAMDDVVQALGGEQFRNAAGVAQILLWAMLLTFLNQLAESACTAANLQRHIPLVTAASTLINIVTNLVLIPRWQIMGAGLAALLSEGLALCLLTLLLKKYIRALPIITATLGILASNMPALALLRWHNSMPFIIMLPFALALTLAGYLVTGVMAHKDLLRLWNSMRALQTGSILSGRHPTRMRTKQATTLPVTTSEERNIEQLSFILSDINTYTRSKGDDHAHSI
ncbi:MAG: hypothetical protein NVS2B12_15480 [Ktedonobacteraceae bacterium]